MIQPFSSTVFCDHHKTLKTPAKSRSKFVCHFYTEILQRSQKQDRKTPQKAASPERASLVTKCSCESGLEFVTSFFVFFFCCIAELAIKPCRSSRSKLRGEFGIPNTCKTGNKNTTKQQTPPSPKHNTKQKNRQVFGM